MRPGGILRVVQTIVPCHVNSRARADRTVFRLRHSMPWRRKKAPCLLSGFGKRPVQRPLGIACRVRNSIIPVAVGPIGDL